MALEVLNGFSNIVDEDTGDLTVTAPKAAYDTMSSDVNSYVCDDKGAGHFAGDYEHLFEGYHDADTGDGLAYIWGLGNVINSFRLQEIANLDSHAVFFYGAGSAYTTYLRECIAGATNDDTYNSNLDVLYYYKVKRDEAVGANGTLYLYIYDDALRTNLLDTLTIALNEKEDFRYYYALSSHDEGQAARNQTGYSQNHDLQEAGDVTIEVSAALSITATINASTIKIDFTHSSSLQTIEITQNASTLKIDFTHTGAVQSITLTQNASSVQIDMSFTASEQSLTLTQYAVTIPGYEIVIEVYNKFKEYMADGVMDLDDDSLKIMLTTSDYSPSLAHSVKADVTNEISGAGYSAGGKLLENITWEELAGLVTLDADDVRWQGATITFRFAVIYDDSVGDPVKPLVCYIDFAGNKTINDCSFDINFEETGILTLS